MRRICRTSCLPSPILTRSFWRTSFHEDVGRLIETLEFFGAEPAVVDAFPEIPESARKEARAAWDVADAAENATRELTTALSAHGIRISGGSSGNFQLKGGSKWKARLFGGLQGPASTLPLTGQLRVRARGATAAIEIRLAEDWGKGVIGVLRGRYESHFDKVLADLRRATQRRGF